MIGKLTDHFNQLTPAEAERLAILSEECSEVIQIIAKIMRHGYESHHPDDAEVTNRSLLAREIGDVQAAKEMMQNAGDVRTAEIIDAKIAKQSRVGRYLHHQ